MPAGSAAPDDRTRRRAVLALLALSAVALVEWVAAAFAYRTTIGPDDWESAARALLKISADEPVVLADEWLGPRARMQLPGLERWLGLADLHGASAVHVLARGEPWSDALREDLAGLVPEARGRDDLGALALHHFALPGRPPLWDLLDDRALAVRDARGACRLSSRTWTCKQGRLDIRWAEVGYRPRRCLALDVGDGARIELERAGAPLGGRLRGHLGFADFNGRLRSDVPVTVELAVDGVVRGRWVVADAQGWLAFEVPTTPGPADVSLRVDVPLGGTFHDGGYDPEARRVACVELRALAEGA